MALATFLFGSRPKATIAPSANGGGLVVDASINEIHEMSSQLSSNEVEDGTNLTDNVRLQPIKLTMEGVVTKTPLSLFGSAFTSGLAFATAATGASAGAIAASAAFVGSALGGAPSIGSLLSDGGSGGSGSVSSLVLNSRDPKDVWKFLTELRDLRTPFSIATGLKEYANMIIISISATRNAQVGEALKFNLVAQQVKIASSRLVQVPEFKIKADAAHTGATQVNEGKKIASPASGSTESSGSILSQGFDAAFGG